MTIIHTPIRAAQANAYAERFVRTVRAECLDWLLIFGRRHLERVLRVYATHYNSERPCGSQVLGSLLETDISASQRMAALATRARGRAMQ